MGGSRREIEELWRERLRLTATRYRFASANYRRVRNENRGPESQALQEALRLENESRAEYLRALQSFTKLVLYGEAPEEEKRSA